ncbi:MAG: glycosyltransferase family 4 protein [Sphingomonadaceae bacterium]|nr:glycosyltransferase family 4 protein [Sphingomonadaceae bacterium]
MPTICLDCRYIGPRPSGIGTVIQALVDYLPELAPDWHFKLLRNGALQSPLSQAANVAEVVVEAAANGPASMWWLPRLVDLADVDLFHAPANILPHGLTMRTVTTIHDVMWLTDPELCNPRPWGWVERAFYRHGINRALRQSDAILTVSEATRSVIKRLQPELASRTHAILPGVADHFRPLAVSASDRKRLGLPPGDYILTIGQDAPYKNHEAALRGFATAVSSGLALDLVFVQRRSVGATSLEQLAKALGVAERVHFLAQLGDADLPLLYSGARALLHPSLCEGFGMPLAEAMACGCPVITSDRSAMPEVTAGAALLVDPLDTACIAGALTKLVDDPALAVELSRKGLARAKDLDRRAFAAATLEAYRRVLSAA